MNSEMTKVCIPSLSRDYIFYHTSDMHIRTDVDYSDREAALQLMRTRWKVPVSDLPTDALNEVLRRAEADNADGVFLCGDLVQVYSPEAVADLKARLDSASVELMYICGNHERFVSGKVIPADDCYDDYAPMMRGNPEYWSRDFGEFLIVGIDNSAMEISEGQMAFLETHSAMNKPILLLMHAPMTTDSIAAPVRERWGENADGYFLIDKDGDSPLTRRFYSFVRGPESHVAAVFTGHIHISHASEFAPGRMQYTSPAGPIGAFRKVVLTAKP